MEPILVRAPEEPAIAPAKVWSLVWLIVRVWLAAMFTMPPATPPPWSAPMVSLASTLKFAPAALARMSVPLSEIALPPLMVRLPALTVVKPV